MRCASEINEKSQGEQKDDETLRRDRRESRFFSGLDSGSSWNRRECSSIYPHFSGELEPTVSLTPPPDAERGTTTLKKKNNPDVPDFYIPFSTVL